MRKLLLITMAVVATAGCGAQPARPAHDSAFVRVDQVGYALDEPKHGFLLSTADPGDKAFTVVDGSGQVVLTGRVGRPTGRWNAEFRSVRLLDFSALKAAGSYRVLVDGTAPSPVFKVAAAGDLFGPLVAANVRFFQAQRDGADIVPSVMNRKPAHPSETHATVYELPRYDEAGTELQGTLRPVGDPVDVSGGWFDAGDFLKFTHTAAYSTTALLLAERDTAASPELAAEARHGMRWLDKMWDDRSGTLYAQVGIGVGNSGIRSDHDVWRLPEDDTISRPVFRAADPGQPISPNLAGKVVAAFALAAQTASGDEARRWLDKAAKLYAQADVQHTGELTTAYPHVFYPESSWQDDMEFAAIELALAGRKLGDTRAEDWIRDADRWAAAYLASDSRGTLGVGDVSALAHADLIPLASDGMKDDLVRDLARQLGGAREDPFGAGASYTEFDAVPHTFGLAATARLFHRVTGRDDYSAFGVAQRNWALGANAWGTSFVIGAGTVFPRCPEHQVANLTGGQLTGAAVNGPNKADKFAELNKFPTMRACSAPDFARFDGQGARYVDDVGAWQSVEPADDFTATALLYFALAG